MRTLVALCVVAGALAVGHAGPAAADWRPRAYTAADGGCRTPGQVLDLSSWKLQAAGLDKADNNAS